MKPFAELTYRGRALRLRRMALAALEHYDLAVRRVRLVTNEMNGIFRVDTMDGQKYILRVTDPSGCHDLEEIRSEMMWLAALRRDTDLGVPEPLTTRDGALVTTVEVPGVPEVVQIRQAGVLLPGTPPFRHVDAILFDELAVGGQVSRGGQVHIPYTS